MAPTPEETVVHEREEKKTILRPKSGDEVVISGMSGIFPSSDGVQTFMENLYNKVDMVCQETSRWDFRHPEMPSALGMVDGMNKFDAQFFRVHYKQGCTMEPMSRKLLEHTYGAIYDAGINPQDLRGKKVGVFVGSTFSESEKKVIYETIQRNGFGITGCNKAMYANRISYWIDGKGPSYALDIACASSMACIEHAYRLITSGECDAAIVGGCNLCKHPMVSLNLKRAGFLCLDGKTKCFDKRGDGYVRSDSISVLFLQRAKDAKRIYSEVYHAKANYSLHGYEDFLPIRETKDIKEFLEDFYSEIDVSPKEVDYVEACGTGIAEADGNELEAIGQVFAKDKPVKVGSVKSNMGHSEPASGVCAATKVCLAYEKGQIPANLNYNEPQEHIPSVRDGKVQILEDHADFNRGFAALNSFSYSGANIHVLLKGQYREKDPERYKTSLPYLVLASGRHEKAVEKIFSELKSKPIDPEQIALLHNVHRNEISGHMSRGYVILGKDETGHTQCLAQNTEYFDYVKRPLWFMYSGMGSQWAGMGVELMKIPIFAAAIEKCRIALEPKGVDIINIITSPDKTLFDDVLNSFVGIAAIQIGLTDILTSMGIVPDNIIGHSVGELGCAYADGCFTAEEMILSAYSRGLVSKQAKVIKGSMAAVGLGYKTVLPLCPPEIEVACHNSSESSTISGPAEIMKTFVTELSEKGVFAKEVPCSNIPYHSRYIADAGPGLLKYLREVIKEPKQRTDKWVSTSVPQEKWNEPIAQLSSAEYHTNNLLNSVLFEETSQLIPANAIVIEIAPHGLLQAIVKRSLASCNHVPLTRRGHADPIKFFLENIGKLYEVGLNPDVSVVYPQVQFPVSTGTPFLSQMVDWEHTENWPEGSFIRRDRITTSIKKVVLSIHDEDYKYIKDHVRNGTSIILPEATILVLVWETFAMYKGASYKDTSVKFEDVKFFGEVIVNIEQASKFYIMIHRANNRFEVSFEDTKLVEGLIFDLSKGDDKGYEVEEKDVSETTLGMRDIYKIMQQRGYNYGGIFQSIHSANISCTNGRIEWRNDWVQFIDALFQLNSLSKNYDGVMRVKFIEKLIITIEEHQKFELIDVGNAKTCMEANIYDVVNFSRCGGLIIKGLSLEKQPITDQTPDVVTMSDFIPHLPNETINVEAALNINLQIVQDNVTKRNINVLDFSNILSISNILKTVSDEIGSATFSIKSIKIQGCDFVDASTIQATDVFIVTNIINDNSKISKLFEILPYGSFVLTLESINAEVQPKYQYFNIITKFKTQNHIVVLMRKSLNTDDNVIYLPIANDTKFSWIPFVESELKKTRRVILLSEKRPVFGLYGMVKSLRKEYGNKIRLILIDDLQAPAFSPDIELYQEQIHKDLAYNVLRQGQWGAVYSLPISMSLKHDNVSLRSTVPGDLDSLTWVEAPPPVINRNIVQVHYAGPSFRDAQKAVGKITSDNNTFGMDFSGINQNGERVMGVIPSGSISSYVEADPYLLWPVPDHWTLEEAATVPLPYLQAYYLLSQITEAMERIRVFIHGGAGALGQAVINLCLSLQCQVFTTVSDTKKKQFLTRLFPELDENNIGYSRDENFVSMVIKNSNKKCCTIVINCASGSIRKQTMKCVGATGFFLDINEADMIDNTEFGLFYLVEEKNYKAVNLSNIFRFDDMERRKKLQVLVSAGLARGIVRPLTRVVYPPSGVTRAMRLLAASRHRGRAIIRMKDLHSSGNPIDIVPGITYKPESSYLVVCSDDGFGLELTDHIVHKGAKNVMIHIRNSNSGDGYLCYKLDSWRKLGANIKMSSENLQTERGCVNLLREVTKSGTLDGLFISQVWEKEKLESNTQNDVFNKYNSHVLVVSNLDNASRNICTELSHFVVITASSPHASTSYVNSATEEICGKRFDAGFPALCYKIQLGDELNTKLRPQPLKAVFNALEACTKLNYSNINSYNIKQQKNNDLIESITAVLGVNLKEIPETTTLDNLSISDVSAEEIKILINKQTGVCYPYEKLKQFTVANLKQMKMHKLLPETKFDSGLGAFYTYIDDDECFATEPMIAMNTKLSNSVEIEDLDPKADYLMLIPGFEGHHQIFSFMCEQIKTHAMTFQLGPDINDDSIPEIAARIMKFMKKRFELRSNFYLMGYSFGVNVALELAALMEKEGHVGIVFCLDSSPEALRVHLDAYLQNPNDSDLQNSIVEHMYRLMAGEDSVELKTALRNTDDWHQKVESCIALLRGQVHYSTEYIKTILEMPYKRIMMARDYQPNLVLDSQIILMKGIPHPKAETLPNDYNLSKYTTKSVEVFDLLGDHATCLKDCRVANVINSHFSPELLEELRNKNICDTYLADAYKTF